MGYSYGAGNSKFGISIIDFTHQEITVSPFNLDYFPIGIGVGSTFICDKSGELLLLSNNCEVFDKNLQALPGSYPLVTSEIAVWDCEDYGDTPILESSLLLPGLGNDSIFYLINKDNVISQEYVTVINLGLYFSKIRLQKDSSLTFLGQEQILTDTLNGARLTAGINNDGTKWWVMVKKHFSDVFHLFLVGGEEGVEGPFTQAVGDVLDDVEMQTSTSTFSPDGKMLALHSDLNQALLYDFNNETGVLSNFRRIPYLPSTEQGAEGTAFSFDSKLLYVTAGRDLYQIDLETESWEHIAHHSSLDSTGWPVGMGHMLLGPDCRIYISPGTTSFPVHVIHHPNEKGQACGFEPLALQMPTNVDAHFPNLPMYRFGGDCDSTIQLPSPVSSTVIGPLQGAGEIQVSPNPANSYLHVRMPQRHKVQELVMADVTGRMVYRFPTAPGALNEVMDITGVPPGMYFLLGEGVKGQKVVVAR
ncbi:MAG: hypothetical protein R2825_08810 [Saprospiraceae bacterium]